MSIAVSCQCRWSAGARRAPCALKPAARLEEYLRFYDFDRVHHGRLTAGQIPADIVYGARKMEVR